MFKSKINGNLDEEFRSLEEYSKEIIKKLNFVRVRSNALWASITILLALLNVALIVMASIALDKVMNDKNYELSKAAPTIASAALVILSFILGFSVTIYQGLMRSKVYKLAAERIQYSTLKWQARVAQYSSKDANEVFKKKIEQIEFETKKIKGKFMLKKALVKILTGGNDA